MPTYSRSTAFEKIVSFVRNPIVLVGFVLFMFVGLNQQRIASAAVSQPEQQVDSAFFREIIDHGAWIAVAVLAVGFGLQRFSDRRKKRRKTHSDAIVERLEATEVKQFLPTQGRSRDEIEDWKQQIREAIAALLDLRRQSDSALPVDLALATLEKGDTTGAARVFQAVADEKGTDAKEAAAAYRHIGALTYFNDTEKALAACRRAAELAPKDARALIVLGRILRRAEKLHAAVAAFHKAVVLGKTKNDPLLTATAYVNLATVFQIRGDLDHAEEMNKKALATFEALERKEEMAKCYGSLGVVCRIRGDLDQAAEMLNKALTIDEELGRKEDMTDSYRNLGVVYRMYGDLDRAEAMHEKALAIDRALGVKDGMADSYFNLGVIFRIRGDLDRAEEMHKRALTIDETLGRDEGTAENVGNLGILCRIRGDLDKAEAMHERALAINEDLDRKEGIARSCSDLGAVFEVRGDFVQAETMHKRALAIEEDLGHTEAIAASCRNLGNVYRFSGDLNKAETMHKRALAIDEDLGRKAGVVDSYNDLGVVYEIRGDYEQAAMMYQEALTINEELGQKEGAANNYSSLGIVYEFNGDLEKAEAMYRKSLRLFQGLEAEPQVKRLNELLNELQKAQR